LPLHGHVFHVAGTAINVGPARRSIRVLGDDQVAACHRAMDESSSRSVILSTRPIGEDAPDDRQPPLKRPADSP
jgi:hypothetical protein